MIRSILLALVFIAVTISPMLSQSWMPVLRDVHGDTISYQYPIADSLYLHNKIIIKFKEGALSKELLCYSCSSNENLLTAYTALSYDLSYPCRKTLLEQQFPVDSGILTSPTLAMAIKSFGGTYLRRITCANPCTDTLSLTRLGDTIKIDHHNWMALELNNDTSAVLACIMLNLLYRQFIDIAEPSYIYESCGKREPKDYYYLTNPLQVSLTPGLIGMEKAWDYQVGDEKIRVSIIEALGLDYRHCDLGGIGNGTVFGSTKVVDGYNFSDNNTDIFQFSWHGTVVAGIIGGLTNRECANANPNSIAGIAGGWGTLGGLLTDEGKGVSLLGYRCYRNDPRFQFLETLDDEYAISAILESSANTFHNSNIKYGGRADIINASWGKKNIPPNETLRRAVYEGYRNNVSFVAARGNDGNTSHFYPASFDGNWVVSVGWAKRDKTKFADGSYENLSTWTDTTADGRYGVLDIIAPGGGSGNENTVFSTDITTTNDYNTYKNDAGSSFAAPHVSGVIALMRSTSLNSPGFFSMPGTQLEPEDYEGIIQATAYRNPQDQGNLYLRERGWGHLQADNVYGKCADENYRAKHYSITGKTNFNFKELKSANKYVFTSKFKKGNNANEWFTVPEQYVSTGEVREVWGTYTLDASEWNTNSDLFVWGRGGTDGTGGYNASNPNHRYPWTEVINGTGGNDLGRYVPGIFHNNSLTVTCRTYQFKYTAGGIETWLPADDDIAFHFTVFGKRGTTSVKLSEDISSNSELSILPNPASDQLQIQYAVSSQSLVSIEIFNVLGKTVIEPINDNKSSGLYSERIDISNLTQGIYYCKISLPFGRILVQPFLVGVGR